MSARPAFKLWLAALVLLAGCGTNLAGEPRVVATVPPAPTTQPTPDDVGHPVVPPDVALGAALYARNCTACHGVDGRGRGALVESGQVPYPGDMTNRAAVAQDTPAQWFSIITNGNLERLMPPWGQTLTEAERWAVTYYSYTLPYRTPPIPSADSPAPPGTFLTDPAQAATTSDAALYTQTPADLPDDARWALVASWRALTLASPGAIAQVPPTPAPTADPAQQPGRSLGPAGRVVNGTRGGDVPASTTVTLYTFANADAPPATVEVTTDEGGVFRFGALDVQPTYTYVVGARYRDRLFFSAPAQGSVLLAEDAAARALNVTVYDLTEDAAVLRVNRWVTQITASGEGLQVAEFVFFSNISDRLFTSSQRVPNGEFASVVHVLPPGAVVLGFGGEPTRYQVLQEQFAVVDTQPVLPGDEHLLQVVYFLPYGSDAIIERAVTYPLEGPVRLLVRPTNLTVGGLLFPRVGEEIIGANTYASYGSDAVLAAGDVLGFRLQGNTLSATATTPGAGPGLPWALLALAGAFGLTALALFGWSYVGANRRRPAQRIEALTRQIASLDDAHAQGHLNHDVYQRQRAALKAELAALLQGNPPPAPPTA